MIIYNSFGIIPTNTFASAGSDFYIPNLNDDEQIKRAFKAFEKSYKKTEEEINEISQLFSLIYKKDPRQYANLTMLFLSVYNPSLQQLKGISLPEAIIYFCDNYVIYDDKKQLVGIKLQLNDTLFVNSGIKVALDTVLSHQNNKLIPDLRNLGIGIAGLYVNKSGKGNAGFDVRACLVDEDYSGFVHLSMSYTKELIEDGQNIVYCGDKLTQMMLIPVFHSQYNAVSEEEYNEIMSDSNRGDSGFGSSDVQH